MSEDAATIKAPPGSQWWWWYVHRLTTHKAIVSRRELAEWTLSELAETHRVLDAIEDAERAAMNAAKNGRD